MLTTRHGGVPSRHTCLCPGWFKNSEQPPRKPCWSDRSIQAKSHHGGRQTSLMEVLPTPQKKQGGSRTTCLACFRDHILLQSSNILDLKIHQSMWIHWPFFPKSWTKGHWPLDDLWPHVCWGHMCDSTQGSLCPSPMIIHQCMWIQRSIL